MALPSSCPQLPDGGKRDVCTKPAYGSVLLYISTDEAQTFTQVHALPGWQRHPTIWNLGLKPAPSFPL